MKLGLTGTGVLAVAGIGALALAWFKRDAIAASVGSAAQAINPASDQNLAYRGVNAVGAAVTGSESFSLGSWLYEVFNPNQPDPTAPVATRPRLTTGDFARMDRQGGQQSSNGEPNTFDDPYAGWAGYGAP